MVEDSNLKQLLYDCKNDKLNKYSIIRMCETPSICLAIGMNSYPLYYTQRHLRKAFFDHSVSLGTLSMLPQAISDPVMIFDSFTRNDTVVFVTSLTNADFDPLIVAIKPNGDVAYGDKTFNANRILSVYGKDNDFKSFVCRAITEDKVLFCNKQKMENVFYKQRCPLPKEFDTITCNRIIKLSENVVDLSQNTKGEKSCPIIEEDERDDR